MCYICQIHRNSIKRVGDSQLIQVGRSNYMVFNFIKIIADRYPFRCTMQQFNRLFSQKISRINAEAKTPAARAIANTFQSHQNILMSARDKEEQIQEKNSRMVVQNLKYRSQIKNKQKALEEKSAKNRKDVVNKIIKSEQQRSRLRRQILLKHNDIQSKHLKDRVKSFREIHSDMQGFWDQNIIKTERQHRAQSAAKQLYSEAVSRKKSFEEREISRSQLLRIKLMSRLHGREKLVYDLVDQKQKTVHQIHKQKLVKNWQKHEQLVNKRVNECINHIGTRFQASSLLLKQKKSIESKKIEDKIKDELYQKSLVKQNKTERARGKSASLSDCLCLKMNNAEEVSHLKRSTMNGLVISNGALNSGSKVSEDIRKSDFMRTTRSFMSSVLYNKQTLREKKQAQDTERLQMQKQISDALALKEQMKIAANSLVRKTVVK